MLSGQIVVMALNESESSMVNSDPLEPSLLFSRGVGLRQSAWGLSGMGVVSAPSDWHDINESISEKIK